MSSANMSDNQERYREVCDGVSYAHRKALEEAETASRGENSAPVFCRWWMARRQNAAMLSGFAVIATNRRQSPRGFPCVKSGPKSAAVVPLVYAHQPEMALTNR